MVRSRKREHAPEQMEALPADLQEADRARVSAKNRYGLAALYGLERPGNTSKSRRRCLASAQETLTPARLHWVLLIFRSRMIFPQRADSARLN